MGKGVLPFNNLKHNENDFTYFIFVYFGND